MSTLQSSRRTFLALATAVAFSWGTSAAARGAAARGGRTPKATSWSTHMMQASARHGGHMNKHVGQSRTYLAGRVAGFKPRMSDNFKIATLGGAIGPGGKDRALLSRAPTTRDVAAAQKRKNGQAIVKEIRHLRKSKAKKSKRASTFHSERTADAMYRQAVRDNRTKIRAFMRNPNKKSETISFRSKTPVGTVYKGNVNTGEGRFQAATNGHFVLSKTGEKGQRARTYYAETAKLYPSDRRTR